MLWNFNLFLNRCPLYWRDPNIWYFALAPRPVTVLFMILSSWPLYSSVLLPLLRHNMLRISAFQSQFFSLESTSIKLYPYRRSMTHLTSHIYNSLRSIFHGKSIEWRIDGEYNFLFWRAVSNSPRIANSNLIRNRGHLCDRRWLIWAT